MARTTHYAESLSQSTTTSTSYQDKADVTQTLDASTDYWGVFTAFIQNSAATVDTKVRLQNTTDTVTHTEINVEPYASGDYYAVSGLFKHTQGGSSSSKTFKVQYCNETGANTARIRDACLVLIKGHADDQYTDSTGTSSTTSGTYQQKVLLNFTAPSDGYYQVFPYAEMNCQVANQASQVKLDVDGTTYAECAQWFEDTTTWLSWGASFRVWLTAGSHNLRIYYRSPSSAWTARIRNAKLLALRLTDTVQNTYYSESLTSSTTSSTSYQDKVTLTETPLNLKHLVIGSALFYQNSSLQDVLGKFIEDSTDRGVTNQEPNPSGENIHGAGTKPFVSLYEATLAASSTTWKVQYRTESGGGTAGVTNAAISLIQLEDGNIDAALAGAVSGVSGISGSLYSDRSLVSSVTGTSSVQGLLGIPYFLTGSISAISALTAALDSVKELAGTITGTSGVSGSLGANRGLSGAIEALGGILGTLLHNLGLIGSVEGSSGVTGDLNKDSTQASTVDSIGSITGSLGVNRGLSGSINSVSNVSGSLSVVRAAENRAPGFIGDNN